LLPVALALLGGACGTAARSSGGGAPASVVAPAAPAPAPPPPPAYVPASSDDPAVARGILRRAGTEIVDEAGQPVRLRGVAFGNEVWSGRALPTRHHAEIDFARVRAMGMNAVRFYMFVGTFEDARAPGVYKEAGWRWLDDNLAWARRHGVYLVLNMHVPPGGFQSMGEGRKLWEEPANQDRLVALWRAIAARYAHEPMIAGYDLLNEPGVTRSKSQWQALATRIAKAIREVDAQHILIVERVNSVAKQWTNDADMNFVLVDDPNVVYTFHFYEPFDYTHQGAAWAKMGEGGRYPDDAKVARSSDTKWIGVAAFGSPTLPPGDSPWTRSEGPHLRATDPRAVIGHVSLVGRSVGDGRALYDDLVIEELDEQDRPVGTLARLDLASLGGWYFWTKNGSGRAGTSSEGHDGPGALTIQGTTDDANLGSAQHEIALRPGHAYAVSGWMRGEHLPPGAVVQIRLDFLGSDAPVTGRNKAFLEHQLDRYVAWGRAHGVPLFLGEFGLHRPCFEGGRGGLAWVADMLDLLDARGLSFTYHSYHEDAFGLYHGTGPIDPARANQGLIDLFTKRLAARP
jgi:endoglucanase